MKGDVVEHELPPDGHGMAMSRWRLPAETIQRRRIRQSVVAYNAFVPWRSAMPLNPDAVGAVTGPVEMSWDSKDALLYAVGVGAGSEDPTGDELAFTTENSSGVRQQMLPTFGVVVSANASKGFTATAGEFAMKDLVHAEQWIRLRQPLPVRAVVSCTTTLTGVYDKGSAALVTGETAVTDVETGELMFTAGSSAFIRGAGGFGGDRGQALTAPPVPDLAPAMSVTYPTRPDQALLYRLSGDRNPLHSDPSFARAAGFPRPILHGLCSYGFTGRALLHSVCGSDPAAFGAMSARFSSPVMPGEELIVQIWPLSDDEAVFRTVVGDRVVLDRGHFSRA
jgi:acyl dehydratase